MPLKDFDDGLQIVILNVAVEVYPGAISKLDIRPKAKELGFLKFEDESDFGIFELNAVYLVDCGFLTEQTYGRNGRVRITANGIDFLQNLASKA